MWDRGRESIVIIRQAKLEDAWGIAKVHVKSWRTTYKGIIPDTYLDALTYEQKLDNWRMHMRMTNAFNRHVYIAEDSNRQIIGFIYGGLNDENNDFHGKIFSMYLLKEFQRKGIGRLLLKTMVEKFISLEINTVMVWVLRDNPSCHFYEYFGGIKIAEVLESRGGKNLRKIAFGWKNINGLFGFVNAKVDHLC